MGKVLLGWLAGFGRFWVDFLVGDTPELFVGAVVAVGLAAALVAVGGAAVTVGVLPCVVIGVLSASVFRARRH